MDFYSYIDGVTLQGIFNKFYNIHPRFITSAKPIRSILWISRNAGLFSWCTSIGLQATT